MIHAKGIENILIKIIAESRERHADSINNALIDKTRELTDKTREELFHFMSVKMLSWVVVHAFNL